MTHPKWNPLRPGELVQVRDAAEILATLDADGTLDGLPFMPEMVGFCGSQFRVFRRLDKVCHDIPVMDMREFTNNDVVTLDGVYCLGSDHDGCAKNCLIFWKERWLQRVSSNAGGKSERADPELLRARLRTKRSPSEYLCQSSALEAATVPLPKGSRVFKCFEGLWSGDISFRRFVALLIVPTVHKARRLLFGDWPVGNRRTTPEESLGLKPGEWVEVKSLQEIQETLDCHGRNRGLHFSPDMAAFCGRRFRVRTRLDKAIMESDGSMRQFVNTVILEGITCECPFTIGGCPRSTFQYWREIWLRRCGEDSVAPHSSDRLNLA